MAQQTAIEWLMEEWPALKYQLPTWLIEQAKQMEKTQIIAARIAGDYFCDNSEAEEYYNEIYKKY